MEVTAYLKTEVHFEEVRLGIWVVSAQRAEQGRACYACYAPAGPCSLDHLPRQRASCLVRVPELHSEHFHSLRRELPGAWHKSTKQG